MSGRAFQLGSELPPFQLLNPAADAAGRTSGYVSLKNSIKAYLVVHLTQGNAATVALTPLQAKDVSGTGSKAISAVPILYLEDVTVTSVLNVAAAAASYTTGAATKNKMVVFEVLPEAAMDIANGFTTLAVSSAGSNAANIIAAEIITLNQTKAIGTSAVNILVN